MLTNSLSLTKVNQNTYYQIAICITNLIIEKKYHLLYFFYERESEGRDQK